jgi:hypothetical protein
MGGEEVKKLSKYSAILSPVTQRKNSDDNQAARRKRLKA